MTNLSPPPERDLDPERKLAIRSVLGAAEPPRRPAVPLLAAAGVTAVVGAALVVPRIGHDEPPAGGSGGGVGTGVSSPRPSAGRSTVPPRPGSTASVVPPDLANWTPPTNPPQAAAKICKNLLAGAVEGAKLGLGAKVVTSMDGRWGTALILTDGKAWAGCDTSGYVHNHASLRKPEQLKVPSVDDNDAFAVSKYMQSKEWTPNGTWYDYYWAAGLVPKGVGRIEYTLPDGETEAARINGPYWLMQHSFDKPWKEGTDTNLPRITVTLRRSDGSVIRTFKLEWGTQTCAAISHGC